MPTKNYGVQGEAENGCGYDGGRSAGVDAAVAAVDVLDRQAGGFDERGPDRIAVGGGGPDAT